MAEFAQTMKDWHRMCKAMTFKKPNDPCSVCKLEAYGCSPVYEAIDSYQDVDFEVVGETITAWAAEHPEPKYQSWGEWLSEIGVFQCEDGEWRFAKANEPIPADIAEKLGIEPKEG